MGKTALAGVDVSARQLVVALERGASLKPLAEFDNDAAGHQKLLRFLRRGGGPLRVCLESSGIYGWDLAMALHRAKGIEVMVANPKTVKDFASAYLRRSKTDALDAVALLEFARRMPFVPWQPPAPEILQLRAISRRIQGLVRMRTQERNRLHAVRRSSGSPELIREDLELHIAHLQGRIRQLRREALALIGSHSRLKQAFQHLTSLRGVGDASAIQILGELLVLPQDMTVRQWVAHAGLDPRLHESGSSVHKRPRISKAGNKHLRRALYMPALVAIQWEPNVNAFYEKLLGRGKTKMQAIVAVMRKLLHSTYGMLKNHEPFDGEKFYALSS